MKGQPAIAEFGRSPYQQGRDDEREAIVAWLRAKAGAELVAFEHMIVLKVAVDAIEAGEHLKPSTDQ